MFFVDTGGKILHSGGKPTRVSGNGPEWVSQDVSKHISLPSEIRFDNCMKSLVALPSTQTCDRKGLGSEGRDCEVVGAGLVDGSIRAIPQPTKCRESGPTIAQGHSHCLGRHLIFALHFVGCRLSLRRCGCQFLSRCHSFRTPFKYLYRFTAAFARQKVTAGQQSSDRQQP